MSHKVIESVGYDGKPRRTHVFYMVQYTPAWWQTRRGCPTASQANRILTMTGKPSGAQESYIAELVGETATLNPNWFTDRAMNPAQRHGLETEPEARRWYEAERDTAVQQVGFLCAEDGRYGASPDGLVGDDGVLELKCVQLKTQALYQMNPERLLKDYKCQCHGLLVVSGRRWVDLASYAPGLEPLVIRVEPDDFTAKLAEQIVTFNRKYDAVLARLDVRRMLPWHEWQKQEAEYELPAEYAEERPRQPDPREEPIGPFAGDVP